MTDVVTNGLNIVLAPGTFYVKWGRIQVSVWVSASIPPPEALDLNFKQLTEMLC